MQVNFTEIKRLHSLGFAIHWIKPKSKVPVDPKWTSGPRLSVNDLEKKYKKGFNVGVRLGEASKLTNGKYLAVLDIDVKSTKHKHADEALAKLLELFPEVEATPFVYSGRGNGSLHYYVALEKPIRGNERKAQSTEFVKVYMPSSEKPSGKELKELTDEEIKKGIRIRAAWEISLLSEGRQVVLPPSVHPDSGKNYSWGDLSAFTAADIAHLKIKQEAPSPTQEAITTRTKRRFLAIEIDKLRIDQKYIDMIVSGDGVEDRSAAAFSVAMSLVKAKYTDEFIISLLTNKNFFLGQTAFDHAKTNNRDRAAYWVEKYVLANAKKKVNETAFDHEIEEMPLETDVDSSDSSKSQVPEVGTQVAPSAKGVRGAMSLVLEWQQQLDLQRGPKDAPPTIKATFKNISLILRNEISPTLLKRNLFATEDTWMASTPWGYLPGRKRSGDMDDALKVKEWLLTTQYCVEASLNMIDEALSSIALANAHHPVKEYLESLEWDGVERVEKFYFTYLGARMPKVYQRAVGRKFFLALVSRIYQPGCKFDHMPVLEGKQGVGKSTLGRILVGDNWFMDGLPEFSDKDAALNLQGIWLCELSELATIYRSANEQAKSFIARGVDKVRPPYGRRRVDLPRSSVFLGTTNARDYLTDSTGNRRFWPIEIHGLDFKALKRDRDQLMAEAKWLYDNLPEPLYLDDPIAKAQAEKIQESRRVEDESDHMYSLFIEWLAGKTEDQGKMNVKSLSLGDMFENKPFLGFQNTMANRRSAGEVLRKCGYTKVHTKHGKRWEKR